MLSKEYGGYNTFSSNIKSGGKNVFKSCDYPLSLARHGIQILVRSRDISNILVPIYTCHSVHEALHQEDVTVNYYHIDNNLTPILSQSQIKESQAILVNNYFGILDHVVDDLIRKFGSKVIVDNAQAFFSEFSEDVDQIKSPRKFVGVSDGGILKTKSNISDFYNQLAFDRSSSRVRHLFGSDESSKDECYDEYLTYRHNLQSLPIMKMSLSTRNILQCVDYAHCKKQREDNFIKIHKALSKYNILDISVGNECAPMCYPFLHSNPLLKKELISKNIYIGTYWPPSSHSPVPSSIEYDLINNLCCLPIDQTLGGDDIGFISNVVIEYIQNE